MRDSVRQTNDTHGLLYIRSTEKWCERHIVIIIIDDTTNKEWPTVKYEK